MINFRNLSNAAKNEAKHQENLAKERKALATPLTYITSRENEKIIKIDKFIFTTFANIESLEYELHLGIKKIEAINTNYYLKIGGNEERIAFEAKIFVEYLEHFSGLVDKIKARTPLSFSTLESNKIRKILIDSFSAKTKDWLLDSSRNATYYTKEFSIGGVVL